MSRWSRRRFLQSLGVGGAALPLLEADGAFAQPGAKPKRLVIFAWSNGVWWSDFWPTGGETDFSFGKQLAPLAPWRDKTLVIGGVGCRVQYEANARALGYGKDQYYGGHDNFPGVLTGQPLSKYADFLEWSGGDSVDQYIAGKLQAQLPFPSLTLGVLPSGGYNGTVSYKGASPGVTPEGDPFKLWKKLFEGRNLPVGMVDTYRAERKSVLDALGRNLEQFGKRLGAEDRAKIQAHLQTIRDIEKQFVAPPAGMQATCAAPELPAAYNARDGMQVPRTTKLTTEVLHAALKCDLTRVATVMLSNAGGENLVFSWLGDEFVGKGDEYPTRQWHDITHNQGKSAAHTSRFIRASAWFVEQVASFVKLLADTREGDGTMLDNTAVVITNSMGYNHDSWTIPFVIVGSCGGYFKTGRYLRYGDMVTNRNARKGTYHNGVLVALANAMGVDGSGFGVKDLAKELPGLRG